MSVVNSLRSKFEQGAAAESSPSSASKETKCPHCSKVYASKPPRFCSCGNIISKPQGPPVKVSVVPGQELMQAVHKKTRVDSETARPKRSPPPLPSGTRPTAKSYSVNAQPRPPPLPPTSRPPPPAPARKARSANFKPVTAPLSTGPGSAKSVPLKPAFSPKLNIKQVEPPRNRLAAPSPVHRKSNPTRHDFQALIHQFPLVSRQVEAGLYTIKRMISYFQKLCTQLEAFTKNLSKITFVETGKEKSQFDQMKNAQKGWFGVQELLQHHASKHAEFRLLIQSEVLPNLQSFYKEAESNRSDILRCMKGIQQSMRAVTNQVLKTKQNALKALAQLNHARNPNSHEPAKGVIGKLKAAAQERLQSSDPAVCLSKAVEACHAYQEAIAAANTGKQKYTNEDLPRIFDRLYKIEADRLNILRDHLNAFGGVYQALCAPLVSLSRTYLEDLESFQPANDIDVFVESWVAIHGEPPVPVPLKYDLPCTEDDLHRGRWNGSMELKTRDSIFNTTLEEVMKIQHTKYPDANVPVILTVLVDAIINLGGPDQKGIFRISASKAEQDELRAQFDKGVYEVKTSSPHVPAGLLKEWLREMQECLIPNHLYDAALDIVRQVEAVDPKADPTPHQVRQIYDQLPGLSQRVIERLMALFRVIVSKQDVNAMGVDNIAIVFSPSFLRCESDDPLEMMVNAKHETKFVRSLIAALI